MTNSIAALIRYKGQGLISWFQTFQPLVNKYKKAIVLATTLNDDELKALWKEHFARQITVSEMTIMKTFQSAHLGTADVTKIKKLSEGIFGAYLVLNKENKVDRQTYSESQTKQG